MKQKYNKIKETNLIKTTNLNKNPEQLELKKKKISKF